MKKRTQILHWINNGCYPGYIMFSCGFTHDELCKLLKTKKADGWLRGINGDKKLFDECKGLASQRTITDQKTGKEITLMYLYLKNSFEFTDEDYIVLSHEVLHLCQFFLPDLMKNREIEAESYYHSHIMRQCLQILRNKK